MEPLHEFSFVVMPVMVCVSSLAGRISLKRRYFTGWYETFHNIKTLTSLILCATLFFISTILLALLLIFAPGSEWRETNLKNGILIVSVYFVAVVGLFCLPRMNEWKRSWRQRRRRHGRRNGAVSTGDDSFTTSASVDGSGSNSYVDADWKPQSSEEVQRRNVSNTHDVKKNILQFLCVFNLAFAVQFFLFLFFLYIYHLNKRGNYLSNFWAFLSGASLDVVTKYNCDLFLLTLLLALTSCTGGLLATIGIDYRNDGEEELNKRNRSRFDLNELVKSIRSR